MSQGDINLDNATASQTAKAVQCKEVSALEVCDAAIARIERLNNKLNAIVVQDFERARTAARALDNSDWSARRLIINGEEAPYGTQVAWPGVATFPGLPATVAPIGHTKTGLPIGVQIIGASYRDYTTIQFAALLEREGLTASALCETG